MSKALSITLACTNNFASNLLEEFTNVQYLLLVISTKNSYISTNLGASLARSIPATSTTLKSCFTSLSTQAMISERRFSLFK